MDNSKEYKRFLSKSQNLCSKQEKCCSEIREKLVNWGAHNYQIEKILKELQVHKFIDEERYANAFTQQKFKINKWGRRKIYFALNHKMIPGELINNALDKISQEDYTDILRDLLERKKNTVKAKNQYDLRAKLQTYAMGKGFEPDLIIPVLNDVVKKL